MSPHAGKLPWCILRDAIPESSQQKGSQREFRQPPVESGLWLRDASARQFRDPRVQLWTIFRNP
jgi:hypothetical protein